MEDTRGSGQKSGLIVGNLDPIVSKEPGAEGLEERLPRKEPHVRDMVADEMAGAQERGRVEELGRAVAEEGLGDWQGGLGKEVREDHEAGGIKAGPERAKLEEGAWTPGRRGTRRSRSRGCPGGGGTGHVS